MTFNTLILLVFYVNFQFFFVYFFYLPTIYLFIIYLVICRFNSILFYYYYFEFYQCICSLVYFF